MKALYSLLLVGVCSIIGCTKTKSQQDLWIYTSLYKDTIADMQPRLEKQFPEIHFHFYQAGSEDIAAKVNAEVLSGGTQADVLIFSDRFWFEEMAQKGSFHSYKPQNFEKVPDSLKNSSGLYSTVSIPVMVMIYNSLAIPEKSAPKTFKEMMEPQWKGKFTTGSPLASGTNFTTMAFLQKAYGWDYFKGLRKNETVSEGGNSAVIRRVQTKERPIGWVLLENALRLVDKDPNLKILYPEDGVILQSNVLAILKKPASREAAQKFADWMFGQEGQEAMVRSYMYSPLPGFTSPKGAMEFEKLMTKAQKWTPELISETLKSRDSLKEEFTKIMFQ